MTDPLSDVLRAVRLTGAVFFDVRATTPWVAEAPPGPAIVKHIFPNAEHLISYHVVTSGSCWGGLVGRPAIALAAGDVIMFPHGDAHVMSSAPGMRGIADPQSYVPPPGETMPFTMTMGGGAEESAHVVCGFLGCDAAPFNPLIGALPAVMHVSERTGGAIRAFVDLAMAESKARRVGGDCVLGRLSELMFVDVVRRYLEALPAESTDWLAGLREPSVGRALEALHREPSRAWTLDALAREAGVSRSVLAERFAAFVGLPPMQYLTKWRMQVASHLLTGGDNVAAVADRVGYDSEAAFSRTFKRVVGVPPGQWRRHRAEAR